MLDKVFKFLDKRYGFESFLYLNGCHSTSPNEILEFYVEWYNSADGHFYDDYYKPITLSDFQFVDSFCPIDFYDETRMLWLKEKDKINDK